MFNRKVKFTVPHTDNKINIDNISNELEKIISASKHHAKEYHVTHYVITNVLPLQVNLNTIQNFRLFSMFANGNVNCIELFLYYVTSYTLHVDSTSPKILALRLW